MKLIEAMKKEKQLLEKATDLRQKIRDHSAFLDFETPVYPDQQAQVSGWLQSHSDVLKEVLDLREGIQRTNLQTMVTIDINGKAVTKSIAAWIHRRRQLADLEQQAWQGLTDRNLKEALLRESTGKEREIKIVRCYDPKERDSKTEVFRTEPTTVDATLEVVNATTDVVPDLPF